MYPSTKLHTPSPFGSSLTAIKPEARDKFRTAFVFLFDSPQCDCLNKDCIFFEDFYHASFSEPKLDAVRVTPNTQVRTFAMLLLLI